jgi:hypothetical protein
VNNHSETIVSEYPRCDFCKNSELHNANVEAHYDAKTVMGPWANMCDKHFKFYGIGLGLGKGQKLILNKQG